MAIRDGNIPLVETQPAARASSAPGEVAHPVVNAALRIGLLTGGGDRPYALGLARALVAQGIHVDFIGSDTLESSELRNTAGVNFLNLRGDQSLDAGFKDKAVRILTYYGRLLRYAATTRTRIFHILWNNKFETFDRTALMFAYRLLGKRTVLTVHNVNAGRRDANDTLLNRQTLFIQYKLANHIFVHTAKMKAQLVTEFAVPIDKVSVIPLGINNTVPVSDLTPAEAKRRLGIRLGEPVLLFYGRIAPYKGLKFLIAAMGEVVKTHPNCRLIIGGSIKDCVDYWRDVRREIDRLSVRDRIIERIEFIPDSETELYFKAADVLVLPYTHIFQSGVLVLSYNFGLPVIAADVGSLREDVDEGKTGYIFKPENPRDLARAIRDYFDSDLYRQLDHRRGKIRDYANKRYSWKTVGETTAQVYARLCEQNRT
jgi:D-inositol-3-phosphate glycosyltransferase